MTGLLLFFLLLLVAINGLFVAAEFALVRSRRSRLEALAREGEADAEEVLAQLEHIDEVLSACQVGITMASIGIGFLGEPAIAELLEPLIDGPVGHGVAVGVSVGVVDAVLVALGVAVAFVYSLAATQPDSTLWVATAAGVSQSLISQVERGLASPSISTLRRIAGTLDVPIAALFLGSGEASSGESDHVGRRLVVRRHERKGLHVPRSKVVYELLTDAEQRTLVYECNATATVWDGAATLPALLEEMHRVLK